MGYLELDAQMKMKRILNVLLVAACIGSSGCGTVLMRDYPSCRSSQPEQFLLYPATHYDWIIITQGGGIYAYGDCDNGVGPVVGWLVVVPLHLIDLPISLVTDTVLLPVDLVRLPAERRRQAVEDERRSRTFEMTAGVQSTNLPALLLLDTSDRHFDGTPASTKPWATFRLMPSGSTVKATPGVPFGGPDSSQRYQLESVYYDKVWVERLKE